MLGKTLFMKLLKRMNGIRIPVKLICPLDFKAHRSKWFIPVSHYWAGQ